MLKPHLALPLSNHHHSQSTCAAVLVAVRPLFEVSSFKIFLLHCSYGIRFSPRSKIKKGETDSSVELR
jgi:hypothetical protein